MVSTYQGTGVGRCLDRSQVNDLIAELCLSDDEARDLQHALGECDPRHGMFPTLVLEVPKVLRAFAPEHLEELNAFSARLPDISPLSPYPLAAFTLLMLKSATLLYPGRPIAESVSDMILQSFGSLSKLPIFKILLQASHNDIGMFVEQSYRNHLMFQNFGIWDLERSGDACLCLHGEGMYKAQMYMLPGYFRQIFDFFDVEGNYEIEWLGQGRIDMVVSWG